MSHLLGCFLDGAWRLSGDERLAMDEVPNEKAPPDRSGGAFRFSAAA